ncbi:MAG: hypothetical protein Q4A42_02815 [Tissierellia bacterium]|nr:hypothetical protein [Tissierellia bacterium]
MEAKLVELVKRVKERAGISIDSRDNYIKGIVEGVINELIDINGIRDLDIEKRISDFMLVVDYSEWRYSSRGEGGFYEYRAFNSDGANVMPQSLAWRIRNRRLMVGRFANE